MNYLEIIPEELINIINSYSLIEDISKLKMIPRIQESFNKKSFWINQLIISQLEDYIPYYKLIDVSYDYFEVYTNIIDIEDFINKFITVASYILLPIKSISIDINKLSDSTDLSYFRENVRIGYVKFVSKVDEFGVPIGKYNDEALTIEIENNEDVSGSFLYVIKSHFRQRPIFKNLSRKQFIIILIKCKIFNLDIWNLPMSDLRETLNKIEYEDYLSGIDTTEY